MLGTSRLRCPSKGVARLGWDNPSRGPYADCDSSHISMNEVQHLGYHQLSGDIMGEAMYVMIGMLCPVGGPDVLGDLIFCAAGPRPGGALVKFSPVNWG